MKFSQYFRLTASPPSLALISLHESADNSGMAPRIARKYENEKVKKKTRYHPLQNS